MRTKLFLLTWVLTFSTLSAQELQKDGRSVKELVPEGWATDEAWGDLNQDGRDDLVLVAVPNDSANIKVRDDGYAINSNTPILAIYYKTEQGKLHLQRQYPDIISPLQDETYSTEVSLSVTPKGALSISMERFFSMGSYNSPGHTWLFRHQNDDFYLIGEETKSFSRLTGENERISINYLTNRQCQVITYEFRDNQHPPKERWTKIPKKPLQTLGSFELEP